MVDDTARPDPRPRALWSRWLWTWSALGTPLVCLAILAWGPVTVLTVAGVAAVVGVLLALAAVYDPAEPDTFRRRLAGVPIRPLAAFTASVSVGLPLLSHAPTLVVLGVVAGVLTSPWLRNRNRHDAPSHPGGASKLPRELVEPSPDLAPAHAAVPEVEAMTDEQLCTGWRLSFRTLETARSVTERARVVRIRQAFLDEIGSRNEPGLRAWLASGARAASGPDRFLCAPAPITPLAWPPNQAP